MTKTIKVKTILDKTKLLAAAQKVEGDIIITRGSFDIDGKCLEDVLQLHMAEGVKIQYPDNAYDFDKVISNFV